jgi:hypothetical protein
VKLYYDTHGRAPQSLFAAIGSVSGGKHKRFPQGCTALEYEVNGKLLPMFYGHEWESVEYVHWRFEIDKEPLGPLIVVVRYKPDGSRSGIETIGIFKYEKCCIKDSKGQHIKSELFIDPEQAVEQVGDGSRQVA